ncbi:signal peptidase I [Bacillus sp. EAC]|uniref:signal peptidase I n=1 Tax=Bacillus sp. EAC TaxID=1978338 RepID=UPI00211B20B0|nr:signal peptidase I [Bacillus sp. EAC]
MKPKQKVTVWSLIKLAAYSFTLAFIVKIFVFSPFVVEGASMQPTLHTNDYLFVNKAAIHISNINTGDVIIIKKVNDPKYYVKRVVGLSGDHVSIIDGVLNVNGKPIKEEYLNSKLKQEYKQYLQFKQVTVPKHSYFVMGDNRLNSKDSRNGLDYIKQSEIVGKAEMIYFPFNRLKLIH